MAREAFDPQGKPTTVILKNGHCIKLPSKT